MTGRPHRPVRTVVLVAHGPVSDRPEHGRTDPTRRLAAALTDTLTRQVPESAPESAPVSTPVSAPGPDWQILPAVLHGAGPDHLPTVLASLPAGTKVTVLPHFAAEGVLTRRILPARLAESGSHLQLTVLPPLGMAPALPLALAASPDLLPGSDLLLVGHGSPDPAPSSLLSWATTLQARETGRRVVPVFLEARPFLQHWQALLPGPDITVIALFAGLGRHVRHDLPLAFGLPPDSLFHGSLHHAAGRRLRFLFPLTDAATLAPIAARLLLPENP